MSLASRTFQRRQALDKGVVDIYAAFTVGTPTAATAVLDLTADITLTSVSTLTSRNGSTFTIQVLPAAANPTDTVLAAFTGSASAIVVTITPNNGTNNTATPVNLTTAQLRELITTGAVAGKTVTITDVSSLRALQTATGGGATNLADGGEGDGVSATFSGGADNITNNSVLGIQSVERVAVGQWKITLQDAYWQLRNAKAILVSSSAVDVLFQCAAESVAAAKTINIMATAAGSAVDLAAGKKVLVKLELKNSSAP